MNLQRGLLRSGLLFCGILVGNMNSCKPRNDEQSASLDGLMGSRTPAFERYKPPFNMTRYTLETLQDQKLKGTFDVFSLSLPKIGEITGNFQMSIDEESDDLVLRQERWSLGADVGPGALIQSVAGAATVPVSINIVARREVTYTRAFATKKQAAQARFMNFSDLPLNSKKALNMNADDFVSIPTKMGMALGLGLAARDIQYASDIGTSVFWLGEFRINVYRLDNSFVRVKIAPSSQQGIEMHANVAARLDLFGNFADGLINIDRQVEKLFGLDFFRMSRSRLFKGERYAIDYVFNLDSPDACDAYDAIFDKTLTLKRSIPNFHVLPRGVNSQTVFADLTPAESLSVADAGLSEFERRRVTRIFQGHDQFSSDGRVIRIGPKALRYSGSRNLSFHKIAIENESNRVQFRSTQFFNSNKTTKSWISSFRESASLNAAAMFDSSQAFNRHDLRDVEFNWNFSQNDLAPREIDDVRELQLAVIGRDAYSRLRINQGIELASDSKKFQSTLRVMLPGNLIRRLREEINRDPKYAFSIVQRSVDTAFDRFKSSRSRFQHFNENAKLVAKGRWNGLAGSLKTPIIETSRNLRNLSEADYTGELFKLLNVPHPAGEIIVPAFLIELATNLGLLPYFSIHESVRDGVEFFNDLNQDESAAYRDEIHRAFYALSHLGYES